MATLAELETSRDQAQLILEADTFALQAAQRRVQRDAKVFRVTATLFTLSVLAALLILDPILICFSIFCAAFCVWARITGMKINAQRVALSREHHASSLTKFVDKVQDVEDRKQMQLMDPKTFELLETEKERKARTEQQLAAMALKAKLDEKRMKFQRDVELARAYAMAVGDKKRQKQISNLVWERDTFED